MSATLSSAAPIAMPAAAAIRRFFGLIAARARPRPNACTNPIRSIAAIHFGALRCRSRACHCRSPADISTAPRPTLTQLTPACDWPASTPPVITVNTVTAATMPTTQPISSPRLVLPAWVENSMRMAATIAMGEIAMAMASGRTSPITPFMRPSIRSG